MIETSLRLIQLPLLLTVAVLAGCASDPEGEPLPARVPGYTVAVYNASRTDLREVQAKWGPEEKPVDVLGGLLVPGSMRNRARLPDPIPDRITVRWESPDGAKHVQDVVIAGQTTAAIAAEGGSIFLKINGNEVTVVVLTTAQIHQRMGTGVPYP